MPDTIANNGTAVPDMSRAAAKAIYPNGGRNRTAARVQAALLRGLVGLFFSVKSIKIRITTLVASRTPFAKSTNVAAILPFMDK